jgi:hypothetical protein
MDTPAQIPGAFCFTEQGTANAGAGFVVASEGPFTIGTTAINWTQFSGTGEITAGTGLSKTGNTLSLMIPVTVADGGTGGTTATLAFGNLSPMTTLGDMLFQNSTPAAARLAGNTATQKQFLSQTGNGTVSAAPAWSVVSGQYLCAPAQYAPSTRTILTTSSSTMSAVSGAASTVAAGSNGGTISAVATWSSPAGGWLDVANATLFPSGGGTVNVAASGATTAVVTYAGLSGGTALTGCAYVSGSPSGTVATGGAVTLTSAAAYTGSFTAPASGSVLVTVSFVGVVGTSGDHAAFGLAAHGTVTPMIGDVIVQNWTTEATTNTLLFLITGLVAGNAYNFDLLYSSPDSIVVDVEAFGQSTTTPGAASGAPVIMTVQAV